MNFQRAKVSISPTTVWAKLLSKKTISGTPSDISLMAQRRSLHRRDLRIRTEVRGQRSRLRRATARQAEVRGREAENAQCPTPNAQRSMQRLTRQAVALRRLALTLLFLLAESTYAQQITLKTGQKIDTL